MSPVQHAQSYEGSWQWDAVAERLKLSPDMDSSIHDLKGIWSVPALATVMDGFSQGRLVRSLSAGETGVNCALRLSDGRSLQMIGAILPGGNAQGLLLSVPNPSALEVTESGEPGPDLEPVFQPIQSIKTGQIAGLEALARWTAIGGRAASARPFDDEGLASNMLIRAVEALSDWQARTGNRELFVHVNLTGRDLEQPELPSLIAALIEGFSLPRGTLRIELTEQAALRDADLALEAARSVKAAGAGLILDDFGSGHSSFSWLSDLPADGLKIDPALTRRIGQPRTDAILRAVANLANELSMTITAEGVETEAQVAAVTDFGFHYAQGYAIARPLPASAVLSALQ